MGQLSINNASVQGTIDFINSLMFPSWQFKVFPQILSRKEEKKVNEDNTLLLFRSHIHDTENVKCSFFPMIAQ